MEQARIARSGALAKARLEEIDIGSLSATLRDLEPSDGVTMWSPKVHDFSDQFGLQKIPESEFATWIGLFVRRDLLKNRRREVMAFVEILIHAICVLGQSKSKCLIETLLAHRDLFDHEEL